MQENTLKQFTNNDRYLSSIMANYYEIENYYTNKYLKKLGYIKSQYQYSEEFLNKNRYYYGMILCEARQPSIDSLHNLIKNISNLNNGFNKMRYLDDLYEEGQNLLTKRLLKYI